MTSLSELNVDELADGICLRAGRIAAAQGELLLWIAEFDRREGWAGPGMLSCAHWLSWRAGMSLGTARDQVRVARRLPDLPELAAAFRDGRVSYSKVRAITRVADPDDGIDWVDLARHSSAAQLDTLVRGVAGARAHEQAQRDPEAAAWRLQTRTRYDDRGGFVMTIRGPAHLLPVITAGLDAKKQQLQRERQREHDDSPAPDVHDPAPPTTHNKAPEPQPAPVQQPSPCPAEPDTSVDDARADGTGPAGTGTRTNDDSGPDDSSLDEHAAGWPAGTTRRQVLEAMDGVTRLQRQLRTEQGNPIGEVTSSSRPAARPATSVPRPAPPAAPTATGSPDEPPAVTDADALLALAQDALHTERTTRPDAARRRKAQLTVQIDPLSGWARQRDGELLPPASLRAVLKTLPGRGGPLRLRPLTDADLRRHDLGRTARDASPALRELLTTLDGHRCRFPGCTRHRTLHAHHVRFWRDGGRTDLDYLILVCSRHHTVLHAQGFQLVLHPDRTLEVHTAHGVPVRHHPDQPWGDPAALATGCGQLVSAETLPPDHCDSRLDLHYAVSVLMAHAA